MSDLHLDGGTVGYDATLDVETLGSVAIGVNGVRRASRRGRRAGWAGETAQYLAQSNKPEQPTFRRHGCR